MIRHQSDARQRRYTRTPSTAKNTVPTKGSMFSFQTPTLERVSNWFSNPWQADPQNLGAMLKYELNHDSVGMTNPCLHIDLRDASPPQDGLETTIPASSKAIRSSSTGSWWPSILLSEKAKKQWRVLTYRRQVGTGAACYQRVKNAALDWEFGDEDLGMINVPATSTSSSSPSSSTGRYSAHSLLAESSHQQLWSGPGGRRFVTYSGSTKIKFRFQFPRIFAINQVMVIYDLVDERAPSTTYTSTAYATMKGHLLSGEERVTVALRDGTQAVEVEIVSVSKPGPSLPSKLLWPFIGKMQNNFFERQLDSLEQAATICAPFGIPSSSNNNNNDQNTRTINPVVIDASNNPNTGWSEVSMANLVLGELG
jgi:uncharacterized protein (UPF0548 family)